MQPDGATGPSPALTPAPGSAAPVASPPARRYLHVNARYYPFIGGSEYYMQQVAERLAAAEPASQVAVYATDAWDLEHFWKDRCRTVDRPDELLNGVQLRRFKVRRLPLVSPLFYPGMRRVLLTISGAPLPDRLALPALSQLCRLTPLVPGYARALRHSPARFDLVHTSNTPLDSLIREGYRYARRHDAAFVITPFLHLGEPHNTLIRRLYTLRHHLEWMKQAQAVFTMTTLERDYLLERGVPGDKMHVVGVGLDPAEIEGGDGASFRRKHNIDGPLVFFQGAAAFDKGTPHLVQAMQRLWQAGRQATLVLAGPVLSQFQRFYDELPERDKAHIRFLGFISPEEKRDLFAAGDIFVMPSRTDSFGIVYLEAWLCGKPVIGARAGGVPAVISEGEDGLLVDFGDVGGLADSITQLLQEPALARRMGQSGRQKVLRRYTWPVVFDQIQAVYHRVLQSGS